MWFATGIVMMYAGGMPRLTPQLRLERLPPLDLARVQLTPAEAFERAHEAERSTPGGQRREGGAGRAQLLTVLDRPAYRVGSATVFADTGELLDGLSLEQSRAVAGRFMSLPADRFEHVGTLDRVDQWTLGQARALPLHKFRAADDAATELYVRRARGEVAHA